MGYQWYGEVTWQLDGYPDSKINETGVEIYKRNAKWYVRVHPFSSPTTILLLWKIFSHSAFLVPDR